MGRKPSVWALRGVRSLHRMMYGRAGGCSYWTRRYTVWITAPQGNFDSAILPRERGLDEPGRFARHHREDLRGRDRYEPVASRPSDHCGRIWRPGCVAERGLAGGGALADRAA